MHAHRCENCHKNGVQTIWVHSDACKGNVQAHTCPKCGKVEWRQYQVPIAHRGGAAPSNGEHAQLVSGADVFELMWHGAAQFLNLAVMTVLLIYFVALAYQEIQRVRKGK